jgi:conjugal transfer pilin signal peptidase TrbI
MNSAIGYLNHRLFRRVFWSLVLLVVALPLAVTAASPWYQLSINQSGSLPGRLYLIEVDTLPDCGDIFALNIAKDAPHYAGKRLLKIALGCPGSTVARGNRRFFVDGRDIGPAKRFANTGDPLVPGPTGELPEKTWFAWTPHVDSYDSRYASFGWVGLDRLVGRAWRVL